jgi:hypothetical protein
MSLGFPPPLVLTGTGRAVQKSFRQSFSFRRKMTRKLMSQMISLNAAAVSAAPASGPASASSTPAKTASTPAPTTDLREALSKTLDVLEAAIDLFDRQIQELLEGLAPFFAVKDALEAKLVLAVMGAASFDWKSEWKKEVDAADVLLKEQLQLLSVSMAKHASHNSTSIRWRLRAHPIEVRFVCLQCFGSLIVIFGPDCYFRLLFR